MALGLGLGRMTVTISRKVGGVVLALAAVSYGCTSPSPKSGWVEAFGYAAADIHLIDVGEFGFPYLPVSIGGTLTMLPFDTGNMVGVSVSSTLFDQMGLRAIGSYDRLNSAGEVVARLRVADAVDVSVLGRDLGPTSVYELNHSSLLGLVGPTVIGGGHFTLDYRSGKIAVGTKGLPDTVPGFRQVPLVRSRREPMLIVVRGTIDDRRLLLELDTGKSRTVINPALASELALSRGAQGVEIKSLQIGDLSFRVPSAKEVDQTGIDPVLPEPILVGVGSDLLSRFVWTVDYETGVLWMPVSL